MRRLATLSLVAVALLSRCASTIPPAPEKLSEPARYLVDPGTGYPQKIPAAWSKGLRQAWESFRGARVERAAMTYSELARRDGTNRVARLGLAAVAIERGRFDEASAIIDRETADLEAWAAAANYRAEIARARGDLREAWKQYQTIASSHFGLHQRRADIRAEFLSSLNTQAESASASERETLMREALELDPTSSALRLRLVRALTDLKRWGAAREELQPLVTKGQADLNEVQAALAEIEIGGGNIQGALRRYERLVANTSDDVYRHRLGEVRQLWQDENLPPHYQRAVASRAITRADLAIIAFWRVDAIRFAQRVGPPPIAVDLTDIAGRDEFVRCLALDIFPVDPVMREANPSRAVPVAAFIRIAARLLNLTRTAPCASTALSREPSAQLAACNIDISHLSSSPGDPVDGRSAARILDAIARVVR